MNLRTPVTLTRRGLIAMAFGLGLLGAAGIVLGYIALDNVGNERTQRKTREGLTAAQVEAIARDVVRLQRPAPSEIVARLREGLPLCSRDAVCARDLRRIAASVPVPAPTAPRARREAPRRPQARTNPPERTRRRPGAPSRPATPGPPDTPQPADPPLVDPPPIDPDGPGGIPTIDLPPIDLPLW